LEEGRLQAVRRCCTEGGEEVKADRTVRLLKTIPGLAIGFLAPGNPTFTTVAGTDVNKGWTIESQTGDPTGASIVLSYEDYIDITGIQAAELSLVNMGGALATASPPSVTFPETGTVAVWTYVSVNPIRGSVTDRTFYGNGLSSPSESQDWFLASNQVYTRDSTGGGYMVKTAENNWGTGGIASSTRLFIKQFVGVTRVALWDIQPPGGGPPAYAPLSTPSEAVLVSPTTIAISCVTADLDEVATAAAIYRGNDLQQTYDNP
jgi:hypothetical protein